MTSKYIVCIFLFINITAGYEKNTVLGYPGSIIKKEAASDAESSTMKSLNLLQNRNNSIKYLLYTPENPKQVCDFEPVESNTCKFNASYETKILIHGYTVQLLPGNFFEQIKDVLLEYNKYNVIIVNWTRYNQGQYPVAVAKAYMVALNVGQMINLLVQNKGVSPSMVHIIGHSLGAHVSGVAGKQVSGLRRVTGLDPAGPMFIRMIIENRLSYTDAELVDVMHTSNYMTGVGLGLGDAIGDIDFYPNGGNQQPACQYGKPFQNADAVVKIITTPEDMGSCYHNIVLPYFMSSIHICNYLSVKCNNYLIFLEEQCNFNSNPIDRMGLFCVKKPNLPVESKFYLNTAANFPYC